MKALKKLHDAAAEHYEKAAGHHRNASEHAAEGDAVEAAREAHIAHAHALHGHELSAQATKKHIDLHDDHEHEEGTEEEEEA
jgi:hypothetical protein